jgi:anti-sigma28 factor (negative regulator of flagellin synthesis)
MSIRVNNTDVALTTQTGPTEQVKPAGSGAGGGSPVSGKTAEDHLEVSASTENINSALANQNLQHSQKIQQLGNLVAAGRYTVDSLDLSRAVISSAIVGPAGEPTGEQ